MTAISAALADRRFAAAVAIAALSGFVRGFSGFGSALIYIPLIAAVYEPRKAALAWKPQNTVAVDDDQGEKLLKLIETLNEHDDVQNVYANFEVSDALMQKMSA